MAAILVVGAGMCGLGTALLLARDGHDVTVVDRDPSPPPESAQDAWDAWERKNVAQFRQPHNLMPGLRLLLDTELPDVQEALRRAGATRFDLVDPLPPLFADQSPRDADANLWSYTARRPVAEWVFARAAQSEPGLALRRGERVTGLLTGPSAVPGVPHVVGARTEGGEQIHVDLVVDAMGRASRSPAWLAAAGAAPVVQEQADCGFTYYTRYFRGAEPERRAPVMTSLGTISLLTIPGDNGTWSVTIVTASGDAQLKTLRDSARWDSVVRACPMHAHWLDGEPITEVLAMSGVVDRYRRFVTDGVPVATGLAAVADAWACTNPSAGRGLTVGMNHAVRLRDAVRGHIGDPAELAREFHRLTEAEIAPWYHAQIATDRFRFAQIEALRAGTSLPEPADDLTRACTGLFSVMLTDPDLFRLGLMYVATITPVQEAWAKPDVRAQVESTLKALGEQPPPAFPGPDRRALLELVA